RAARSGGLCRGAVRSGRACGAVWSCFLLVERDVVDQAGGADADRAGQDGRPKGGDLCVVALDPGCVQQLERAIPVTGGESAGEGEGAVALVAREPSIPGGEREAV